MRRRDTLLLALALDWLAGEPPAALHPVVWLGRLISTLERRAPRENPRRELLYGAGMTAVCVAAAAAPAVLMRVVGSRERGAADALTPPLLKTTFAWRALHRAAGGVWQPLAAGDLDAAREKLSWLVSRDASLLDEPLIAAAAIESLAENASDSVVAPLLAYVLFGLSGAFAYRAVNTLDAMIGYHGRYEHLGKVPARLDDLLNLVPARLTALLIVAAALPGGADARQAWRVMWQDSRRTASPNAGWPMAAMAGALGVRLEKVGHYCLNASGRAPTAGDLRRAGRVVLLALALGVGVIVIIEGGYHAYQSSLSSRH